MGARWVSGDLEPERAEEIGFSSSIDPTFVLQVLTRTQL